MDIEINDNNNNNKNNEDSKEVNSVIDIEMQKDADEKDSERFIKYVNYLDAFLYTKKVWLITLIFQNKSKNSQNKNNSSKISYKKSNILNHRTIKEYKNHLIFEIDIIFLYEMIKKTKKYGF